MKLNLYESFLHYFILSIHFNIGDVRLSFTYVTSSKSRRQCP